MVINTNPTYNKKVYLIASKAYIELNKLEAAIFIVLFIKNDK